MVSTPEPPNILSLPAKPLTVSAPLKLAIRSDPEVPVMLSSPSVPIITFALGKLALVSVPKISATVSAARITKVSTLASTAVCNVELLWPEGYEPSLLILVPAI